MKVLFDTNVILDTVLARVPFIENAAYLFEAVELGKIQGFISATTVTDIHYLVKRHTKSAEIAIATIEWLYHFLSSERELNRDCPSGKWV